MGSPLKGPDPLTTLLTHTSEGAEVRTPAITSDVTISTIFCQLS
jgi:hypothetical protein